MPDLALSLLCHAPTGATRQAAFPRDEALDPQGWAAAAAAAPRRVDAAWSSPALRARQTAEAMKLTATPDPLLRELDYGTWSGRSLESVATEDPAGLSAWLSDHRAAPHGGDTIDALFDRVSTWLDIVGAEEGRVVAVTHATVMRAALVLVLDARPPSFWRIDIAPLGRVRLSRRAGRWTLRSVGAN